MILGARLMVETTNESTRGGPPACIASGERCGVADVVRGRGRQLAGNDQSSCPSQPITKLQPTDSSSAPNWQFAIPVDTFKSLILSALFHKYVYFRRPYFDGRADERPCMRATKIQKRCRSRGRSFGIMLALKLLLPASPVRTSFLPREAGLLRGPRAKVCVCTLTHTIVWYRRISECRTSLQCRPQMSPVHAAHLDFC
jgi:hypothetical protein